MNVLVLCDDFWHPGEVIRRGLAPLEKDGFVLDFVEAPKDILTNEFIRRYDVIVNTRGNAHSPANRNAAWFEPGITAVMPEDFKKYVEEGHGFVAIHAGNTFRIPWRSSSATNSSAIRHSAT